MHRQAGPRTARRAIVVVVVPTVLACLGLVIGLVLANRLGGGSTGGRIGAVGREASSSTGTAAGGPASPGASSTAATGSGAGGPSPSVAASASASPAAPCASPAACGFPTAADTGPRTSAFATHSGNLEIRRDGETVSGWNLSGSLDIYANDVTVIDTRIESANWWAVNLRPGYTGLRVLHSLLTGRPGAGPDGGGEDYAVSNMGEGTVEVGWDDVSAFGDALSLGHGSIHDDYVHDLQPYVNRSGTYQHLDAILSDGDDRQGLRVEHNTLLNPVPVAEGTTSVIGLLPNTGPISDTVVSDNWIAGGAYALYGGGAGATGVVVTGNVFSTQYFGRCGYYGPVAYWNSAGSGNQWSGNRYSSGASVAPGAAG